MQTNQSSETASTLSYPSQTQKNDGSRVSLSSTRRQVGAECLLLDVVHSFMPVQSNIQDKEYHCWALERVEIVSNF